MTEPHKIWIEQCEAVEGIGDDFGPQNAIGYLVGEKFLNFLEAAETNADFRAEIPAFVDRIKTIFGNVHVTCCGWSVQGNGCWRRRIDRREGKSEPPLIG